jgi:hypothetical protein
MNLIPRRTFLRQSALAAGAAFSSVQPRAQAAPGIKRLETKVISHQPEYYHGGLEITRTASRPKPLKIQFPVRGCSVTAWFGLGGIRLQ